jgi:ribonuclease P/MRP protein subunit POP5
MKVDKSKGKGSGKAEAKMKVLPPTMRKKHRYVGFRVISEEPIMFTDLDSAVWNTALDFYGEHGVSSMDLWLIKNTWDENGQSAIIRCSSSAVPATIAFLGVISRLGDTRIAIDITKISGTIRSLDGKQENQ